MKKLREGVSTGSCMTGAAIASAIWQLSGKCPESVCVRAPIGRDLYLDIVPIEHGVCAVVKDGGDDIDMTDGCSVIVRVIIHEGNGEIQFVGKEGIGVVTLEGLKLPVGEPAINPVPRQMTVEALRKIIKERAATVEVSIPNGAVLAKKTFNERLGVIGGLSILGTTGIVRPMSQEAMRDSIIQEMRVCRAQGNDSIVFVLGTTGENALRRLYGEMKAVLQVSNFIGDMLDEAVDQGFKNIFIGGFVGKLVKVASGTMNTHSHIADGRLETICTHAALVGVDVSIIRKIYNCVTTKKALEIMRKENLLYIWESIVQKAEQHCQKRVRDEATVAIIFLDENNNILAESQNVNKVRQEVFLCTD